MDARCQRIVAVGLIGIVLTLARRWKNKSPEAGIGVAGWTMFVILLIALD